MAKRDLIESNPHLIRFCKSPSLTNYARAGRPPAISQRLSFINQWGFTGHETWSTWHPLRGRLDTRTVECHWTVIRLTTLALMTGDSTHCLHVANNSATLTPPPLLDVSGLRRPSSARSKRRDPPGKLPAMHWSDHVGLREHRDGSLPAHFSKMGNSSWILGLHFSWRHCTSATRRHAPQCYHGHRRRRPHQHKSSCFILIIPMLTRVTV